MQGYAVLEVALILVKRVVLVDILNIGRGARCLILAVAGIALGQRIALSAVVVFVALDNRRFLHVIIAVSIERIVVRGRVIEGRERIILHRGNRGLGQ